MVLSPPTSWKSTWPRSHFLVTLLWTYYVTRKRCLPLHDDALDTTAHGVPFDSVAPLPPSRHCVWRVAAGALFSRGSIPSVTRATLHVPSARARPQVFLTLEKAESVKHLDAVFGEANLPSWCVIVLRHCGHVTGAFVVFCPQKCRRRQISSLPQTCFFNVSPEGIQFTYNRSSGTFILFPVALKCRCGTIATMFSQAPRRDNQDLCCFPSWLYFLDGEDNCMLSVPSNTSDLHYSSWQSGENCQAVAAGAFTFILVLFKGGCCRYSSVLLSGPRVVCSMFPSFRPDTASIPLPSVVATGIP